MDEINKYIISALTVNSQFNDLQQIKDWISEQNFKTYVNVKKVSFEELDLWNFSKDKQNLSHNSGKFFSIDGIDVKTNWGGVSHWQQPIINQPEIGYLGFITKEFNGVLYFLLQAKIEPGNVNCVQLSPTLQATKSNYSQVHKGKKPNYLEYFQNAKPSQILVDQLQSEQGARFLRKRNRNIIIKVEEEVPILDNFIWATLGQIKLLMQEDNLVNMDTRTVISCIPYGSLTQSFVFELSRNNPFLYSTCSNSGGLHTFDDLIQFITKRKCEYDLEVTKVSIHKIDKWIKTEETIKHVDDKFFRIIATEVSIENREVVKWTQPMVEPAQEGICAFICKEINGKIHFIVQAKLEAGNFDILELAPTVQCLTGNYILEGSINFLPFLKEVLNASKEQIVFDTLQSEEGGRFYKEQNRNLIIKVNDEFDESLPENYIWMTLNQMQMFIKFNNYLNIQSRSLIAAISFI